MTSFQPRLRFAAAGGIVTTGRRIVIIVGRVVIDSRSWFADHERL
jgi:hypothetical protein